jgi:hypothetical protein
MDNVMLICISCQKDNTVSGTKGEYVVFVWNELDDRTQMRNLSYPAGTVMLEF